MILNVCPAWYRSRDGPTAPTLALQDPCGQASQVQPWRYFINLQGQLTCYPIWFSPFPSSHFAPTQPVTRAPYVGRKTVTSPRCIGVLQCVLGFHFSGWESRWLAMQIRYGLPRCVHQTRCGGTCMPPQSSTHQIPHFSGLLPHRSTQSGLI